MEGEEDAFMALDLSTWKWSRLSGAPRPRQNASAVVHDGEWWVFGGRCASEHEERALSARLDVYSFKERR